MLDVAWRAVLPEVSDPLARSQHQGAGEHQEEPEDSQDASDRDSGRCLTRDGQRDSRRGGGGRR